MILETNRLIVVPLTPEQLFLWAEDLPKLEQELDCAYRAEPMEGFFRDIVLGQAERAAADPENYLWHTFWFIIRKEDRCVVGSIDYKNVPENGEVEIGYGLGRDFEHLGYMTETVQTFVDWALRQEGVRRVVAETEKDNFASQRVLTRCGFQKYKEAETLWWELR